MEILLALLMKIKNKRAASLVMQLFASLSLQTFGFNPKAVHVDFLGTKLLWGSFSPSISVFPCHYHSTNALRTYFIHLPSTAYNLGN
jgi:hypothetical protein